MKANNPTTTLVSVARCAAILTTGTIAMLGLMAEPFDTDPWWFEKFFISKAIALGAGYATYRLYERWRKTDKWIMKYDKSCEEAIEQPNPLYIDDDNE